MRQFSHNPGRDRRMSCSVVSKKRNVLDLANFALNHSNQTKNMWGMLLNDRNKDVTLRGQIRVKFHLFQRGKEQTMIK